MDPDTLFMLGIGFIFGVLFIEVWHLAFDIRADSEEAEARLLAKVDAQLEKSRSIRPSASLEHPFVMKHLGEGGCGEAACFLDQKPEFGDKLSSAGVFGLDGVPIPYGTPARCGSCGKYIRPMSAWVTPV